jgi:hypothetical protein
MRLLGADEKKFCEGILKNDGKYNCFENIIDLELSGVRISIKRGIVKNR